MSSQGAMPGIGASMTTSRSTLSGYNERPMPRRSGTTTVYCFTSSAAKGARESLVSAYPCRTGEFSFRHVVSLKEPH